MASKSKVLVIGATGYIGRHIALAGPAEGHPTFVLVRPSTLASNPPVLHSFQAAGITLLQGSLEDYESLVAAVKQVDVVISAISPNPLDQLKIIEAIKEVGTIKRFIPSEFGNDPGLKTPPRDKVSINGSGDVKFISVLEEDVGAYTMKTVDDPRTLNKILHIRPSANIMSMNSLVEMWERMIGKTLEKVTVTEEDMVKQIQETPDFNSSLFQAVLHDVVIQGAQCNFDLGPNDVEATTLYLDHKYTSAQEYLARFL
ncbi:hypothetical protein GOP47_0019647 [Adiantum capillus-veneris]|uniref:NmrA-like domain-containing protein n=1 Tax=Adiantum capillus-veneris TaxID=13818 RepID=A0A9D4UBW8_ADICA|nr:hypothetical protein GOP47_0019647 [Adiantum capillus-veneris]